MSLCQSQDQDFGVLTPYENFNCSFKSALKKKKNLEAFVEHSGEISVEMGCDSKQRKAVHGPCYRHCDEGNTVLERKLSPSGLF